MGAGGVNKYLLFVFPECSFKSHSIFAFILRQVGSEDHKKALKRVALLAQMHVFKSSCYLFLSVNIQTKIQCLEY